MKAEEVVTPVLPRSPFDSSADRRDATPVRIPTRGPRLQQSPVDDTAEFHVLIGQFRRRVPRIPLNVVLAGMDVIAPGTPGLLFLNNLLGYIEPSLDTVWIIGSSSTPPRNPAVVMLDRGARDQRIGDNLVPDILFVSGADENDIDTLKRFSGRASLLIVPSSAPRAGMLAEIATDLDVVVLEWDAPQSRVHLATSAEFDITLQTSELTPEHIDQIGLRLASLAKDLTKRPERRAMFRKTLTRLMRMFELHPHWNRDLIEQADKFSWPSWAVQMLPKLYLRLEHDADPAPALVWRPLIDWSDDYPTLMVPGGTLCRGEILKVRVTRDLDKLLSDLCTEIEENLRGNPFHGDGVFFGRISDAVSGVAVARRDTQPEVAQRLLELSRELLSRYV